MQAKLTLRLEDKLIKNAREYAKRQHKSLSQIVAEFFSVVSSGSQRKKDMVIGPVTSKLAGSLKGAHLNEDDYKDYLLGKYL
jgi:3-polyprenyl-4-hydroxybenzoate decarboxylase